MRPEAPPRTCRRRITGPFRNRRRAGSTGACLTAGAEDVGTRAGRSRTGRNFRQQEPPVAEAPGPQARSFGAAGSGALTGWVSSFFGGTGTG